MTTDNLTQGEGEQKIPSWARPNETRYSPHFFKRQDDGSVRLRMRLTAKEASLIEEGAGETPLMVYIHRVLTEGAKRHVKAARKKSGA